MLRPPEIRSVPFYNDAYIAIANCTGNIADHRHGRRRIRLGPAWAISFMPFGHEVVLLSPILVWSWNDPEDSSARLR